MRRDGENVSIWQKPIKRQIESMPTPPHVDVVIIGGGITGLTSALSLQAAGKSCLVLDAHQVGFGTTGGTSAHLNTVLDTPYHQVIDLHGKSKSVRSCELNVGSYKYHRKKYPAL